VVANDVMEEHRDGVKIAMARADFLAGFSLREVYVLASTR
jgi:hypothetical protein